MACAILLVFVPYNLFIGKQLLKTSKLQEADAKSEAGHEKQQPAGADKQATEKKLSEHTEL